MSHHYHPSSSLHDAVVVCSSFRLHGGNSPFLHLLYRRGDGQRLKAFLRRMTSGARWSTRSLKLTTIISFLARSGCPNHGPFPNLTRCFCLNNKKTDYRSLLVVVLLCCWGFLEPVVCVAEDNRQCLQSRILKLLQNAFMRKSGVLFSLGRFISVGICFEDAVSVSVI